MKITDDHLILESDEEIREFEKLVNLAKTLEDKKKQKAERVFSQFLSGQLPYEGDDSAEQIYDANEWANTTDALIHENLDHSSLGYFVELVLEHHERASQAARAHARHAENYAMRKDVFDWLDKNPPKPRGKDAAAQAIAGKVVPISFRAARKWIDEWEKLRSTGTT
ncbi:MAG: hypothetical protein J0I00_10390 [Burkholderiales bacterium]|nr:hypothetical protein [Burkholderiales bacterium]